jgi:glycosyltransferase involved in cell wall biosynthesis
MIRVLHLRDTDEIGGPGKTILETHRAIDSTRFALHLGVFVTRHEQGDSPFVRAARGVGMPVHFIRGYNQYDPRLIQRVRDLTRTLKIDLLHAHEVKSDVIGYLASRLGGVPVMTTLHGWIGNSTKQRLFIALDRKIVRWFDRAIAVSGPIHAEMVAAGMPPDRVRLLHNAIVLDRYQRTGQSGFLAELLGRAVDGPVIASIGRLSPEKGHADLIEALGVIGSRGFTPTVVLAGEGPERPRLAQMIGTLGLQDRVHLPGHVSNLARLLEESNLLVLPSHTEGLPNAALEALAMNVPVLATRVGGTPEVINDGETGRLVEAHRPEQLAGAMVEYLTNPQPWLQMAERGREMVREHFNFATRTRRLEAVYAELVSAGRS